jgi:hypothetical protein
MALQSTITTDSGITVENAYSRVEKVKLTSKKSIAFELGSYVSQESTSAFNSKGYLAKYDLSGDNPIRQAYLYLKTLPEYENADDV